MQFYKQIDMINLIKSRIQINAQVTPEQRFFEGHKKATLMVAFLFVHFSCLPGIISCFFNVSILLLDLSP